MIDLFHPTLALAFHLNISAVLALVAGILILIRPKLLNLIVAIYLIVVGIMGLIH